MTISNQDQIKKLMHHIDASTRAHRDGREATDRRNVEQRPAAFQTAEQSAEQSLPWTWDDAVSAAADLGDEAWRFGAVSEGSETELNEANDVQQLASLEFDQRPHYYSDRAEICSADDAKLCTPEDVFYVLRRYAAPLRYHGRPVETGDETTIGPFGTVVHEVDEDALTVTNITKPGHVFHPGYVNRSVVVEGDTIFIVSEGEGTGNFATINEGVSGAIWGGFNAARIRERVLHGTRP